MKPVGEDKAYVTKIAVISCFYSQTLETLDVY